MPSVARIGDPTSAATCPENHGCSSPCPRPGVTGTVTSGSGNVFANGASLARIGDPLVLTDPFHPSAKIVAGSGTVFVNGASLARIGDNTTSTTGWTAPISSGSGNVIAN